MGHDRADTLPDTNAQKPMPDLPAMLCAAASPSNQRDSPELTEYCGKKNEPLRRAGIALAAAE